MLGSNEMFTLVDHFVSSPREKEKRLKRDNRGYEKDGQGRETGMKVKKQMK